MTSYFPSNAVCRHNFRIYFRSTRNRLFRVGHLVTGICHSLRVFGRRVSMDRLFRINLRLRVGILQGSGRLRQFYQQCHINLYLGHVLQRIRYVGRLITVRITKDSFRINLRRFSFLRYHVRAMGQSAYHRIKASSTRTNVFRDSSSVTCHCNYFTRSRQRDRFENSWD